MSVRLFQDIRALESLRSSDFDALSAYGEVVDNSIQAGATEIQIKFDTSGGKSERSLGRHIRSVAFGDNGNGMDADTLHRCLQIGWSSRYNERDGIGRFGVGMTLGAIHECKRVDIWTKTAEASRWFHTYMDLEEIAENEDATIPEPDAHKGIPKEWANLITGKQGTLVVWSKYDGWSGNENQLKEHLDEFNIWLGRTYRYFIWDDNLIIKLNGEIIKAIDPLYVRTEKTRFPTDPPGKKYEDIRLDWPRDDGDGSDKFFIRLSLLPFEFRRVSGAGGNTEATKRFIDRNQGFSILRNRREVFYGELPYWGAGRTWQFDDPDRWWGGEIEFPATLDRAFTIKNIKRGAQPIPELRSVIKKHITPTRTSVLEEVRKDWGTTAAEPEHSDSGTINTGHQRAESIAKITPTPGSKLGKGKDKSKESDKVLDALGEHYDAVQKAKLKNLFLAQPFTILNDSWVGGDFFEVTHMGGNAVLKYNLAHVFHVLLGSIMEQLSKQPEDAPEVAVRLREMVDLLLISYTKAESRFEHDEQLSAEQFVEHLRADWGRFLKTYLETWKKEHGVG